MRRHPSLEPFSRDHNDGLILARRLSMRGEYELPSFHKAWEEELRDHFAEEERLLQPLCTPEEWERMIMDHETIRTLGLDGATEADARQLGELLHDHIRWEERELFIAIERRATPEALDQLGKDLEALEERRGEANPRRAELVERRKQQS